MTFPGPHPHQNNRLRVMQNGQRPTDGLVLPDGSPAPVSPEKQAEKAQEIAVRMVLTVAASPTDWPAVAESMDVWLHENHEGDIEALEPGQQLTLCAVREVARFQQACQQITDAAVEAGVVKRGEGA